MESSKGESEKSQSIKLNVILSVPPLFIYYTPPLEPFCHPPPFRQKGAFYCIETLFPYDKNAPLRMRTRRRGRWLPKQPRLGARMCQGTFFFYSLFVAPCGQIPCSRENLSTGSHEAHSNVCAFYATIDTISVIVHEAGSKHAGYAAETEESMNQKMQEEPKWKRTWHFIRPDSDQCCCSAACFFHYAGKTAGDDTGQAYRSLYLSL